MAKFMYETYTRGRGGRRVLKKSPKRRMWTVWYKKHGKERISDFDFFKDEAKKYKKYLEKKPWAKNIRVKRIG